MAIHFFERLWNILIAAEETIVLSFWLSHSSKYILRQYKLFWRCWLTSFDYMRQRSLQNYMYRIISYLSRWCFHAWSFRLQNLFVITVPSRVNAFHRWVLYCFLHNAMSNTGHGAPLIYRGKTQVIVWWWIKITAALLFAAEAPNNY